MAHNWENYDHINKAAAIEIKEQIDIVNDEITALGSVASFTGKTEISEPAENDYLRVWDDSASEYKKIKHVNFPNFSDVHQENLYVPKNFVNYANCQSTKPPGIDGSSTDDNCTFERSSEQYFKGEYSYKMTKTGGTYPHARIVSNGLSVDMHRMIRGRKYKMSAFVYVPSIGGPANVSHLVLQIQYYDPDLADWVNATYAYPSVKDSWEYCETGVLNIPSNATGFRAEFVLNTAVNIGEYVYISHICVEEIGHNNIKDNINFNEMQFRFVRSVILNKIKNVTAPAAQTWRGVCWSPELNKFCAVSSTGTYRSMTSSDGRIWTLTTQISVANEWFSVCWSPELSLFCAVSRTGAVNRAMTSPDGITWTTQVTDNSAWTSVCWSPELGLFCAVAQTGQVMTSPNGTNWTNRTPAVSSGWGGNCWSPELHLFCAVAGSGAGNRIMLSSNGIDWVSRAAPSAIAWDSVCWSPELNLFCSTAASGVGNRVMTSSDGLTWTTRTSAEDHSWFSVNWSAELRVFLATSGTTTTRAAMTSEDGINWISRTTPSLTIYSSCWSPDLGMFCMVPGSGTLIGITEPCPLVKEFS